MKKLQKEREIKETEEYMRNRLEADQLFHMYEEEKHRKNLIEKHNISKNNLMKAVSVICINLLTK